MVTRTRFAFLDHPAPIAFAHRGGALEAPENTWEAFRHAVDLGYVYIETDVHATADGIVVTAHDPDLSRTMGRPGMIRAMRWSALSALRPSGSDSALPRLDEALASWPEVRWNIDAKHDTVVGPLIETIHRSGAIDRVCITSFDERRTAKIHRALGPRLCSGLGPFATAALRIASVLPAAAEDRAASLLAKYGAAQVPLRQGRLPLVDPKFVSAAHRIGLAVHVWTVDDADEMRRLVDLGVDGIMTDRPSTLKDVLVAQGRWP